MIILILIKEKQDSVQNVTTFLTNLTKKHKTLVILTKKFLLKMNLDMEQPNVVIVTKQNEYNWLDFTKINF